MNAGFLVTQIFKVNIQLLEGRRKQHLSGVLLCARYFITITFSDFYNNPKRLAPFNRDGS